MSVSVLRESMTDREFAQWRTYYGRKAQRHELAQLEATNRAKPKRRR